MLLLLGVSLPAAVVVTATADTDSSPQFSVASGDLLEHASVINSTAPGVFAQEGTLGRAALTDGSFGSDAANDFASSATCADGARLIYLLDFASSGGRGYDITSITTYSSWGGSREDQHYTVAYATVDDPATFIDICSVAEVANTRLRCVITDDGAAPLATRVVALRFTWAGTENGYEGFREIDAIGSPTASGVVVGQLTYADERSGGAGDVFAPMSGDLLESASVHGVGTFDNESCVGLPALTDGAFGLMAPDASSSASLGTSAELTYDLDLAASAGGYDLTSIATYSGWDGGRDQQCYTVAYATVGDPGTFVDIASVDVNPAWAPGNLAITSLAPDGRVLASGVAKVRFTIGATENGWAGYRELDVAGYPTATQLSFLQAPTDTVSGVGITPSVTVRILDAGGNLATHATAAVALAIGTNPGSGTLSGTTTVNAVAGVATFSGLSIDQVGSGYTLTASATGLAGATSSAFNITAAAASKLAFVQQPGNTAAGAGITPSITVQVQDAGGSLVAGSTAAVTLAVGTNPGGGTLSGTVTVNAVAGVATFSGLSIDQVGSGYTLTASASGLTGATSSAFNITAAAASKLAFVQQPGNTAAGAGITPSITVQVQDAGGSLIAGSTAAVTLAIGTNPGGGTLSGTVTVNAVAGVATFSGLSIDQVGSGYTLTASATGLTGATSGSFDITAGTASRLAFLQQPTSAVSTAGIAPSITVQVQDAGGNAVTGSTAAVTLAIGTNPGTGTLSGTVTVNAVAGVATFSGLSIDRVGSGYTLTASAAGLTGATSSAFDITVGSATTLAFLQQPTSTIVGIGIAPGITVQIQDAGGNAVTGSTAAVTLAIGTNPGGGTLSGTVTVNAVAGVATFSGLSIDQIGSGYTLSASSAGLTGATSSAFDITSGTASRLAFLQQPSNAVVAASITPSITVQVQDAGGSLIASSTAAVTLAIGTNPGTGILSGTVTVNAVAGVATFPGLSIDQVGSGYTLTASSAGLTGASSSVFDITSGIASRLAFLQQPTSAVSTVGIAPSITVQVQDAGGSLITSSTAAVTLAIGTNPGTGTLSGTVTVNAVAGVATFPGLSIDRAGSGYTLTASASGLTGATSTSFDIAVGSASRLAFLQQPTSAVSMVGIAPSITVQVQDAGGNAVIGSTAAVTLAIGTNPGAGTLSGTATVNAVAGVATFPGLSIDRAGSGYTLTTSADGLTGATSSAFDVTVGSAITLAFLQQPTNTTVGIRIAPSITVQVQDAGGNAVIGSTAAITLAIGANPGTGILSGTVTVNAVAGVATFSGLSIDQAGSGYTLSASSSGLAGDVSVPFDIDPSGLSDLTIESQEGSPGCGPGGLGAGLIVLLALNGLCASRRRSHGR